MSRSQNYLLTASLLYAIINIEGSACFPPPPRTGRVIHARFCMTNELELSANELPIACNLSESHLAARQEEIKENLFKGIQQVKELADGYAFSFPGSEAWAAKLTEFIVAERNCCPFFTFELVFEPDLGPIWLHLRGAEGVKEFIAHVVSTPHTAQYYQQPPH